MLGGHVRAVFTLITILFVLCVLYTVTSFKELPLELLERDRQLHEQLVIGYIIGCKFTDYYFVVD